MDILNPGDSIVLKQDVSLRDGPTIAAGTEGIILREILLAGEPMNPRRYSIHVADVEYGVILEETYFDTQEG
jgi:hypothetical protein